jgi:hypothetical protein
VGRILLRTKQWILICVWWQFLKTVDASGHAFHVCHAVFSPLPWYADTTSQPLNARINRRHIDLSRSIEGLLSFMRIHCFVLNKMRPTVFYTKSLAYWGWKKQDDIWQMFWTILPPIAQRCQQLMKSGCKTEFRGTCKCYCFSLPCISLGSCNCGGYNLFMIFAKLGEQSVN